MYRELREGQKVVWFCWGVKCKDRASRKLKTGTHDLMSWGFALCKHGSNRKSGSRGANGQIFIFHVFLWRLSGAWI